MVPGSLSARRRGSGYALAVTGAAGLVAVLVPLRGRLDLASDALLLCSLSSPPPSLAASGPALVAGALAAVMLNFFFTEPFHSFRIRESSDIVAVLVFAAVAVMVSWVVDLAARRASAAREAVELEAGNRLRTALLAAVGHDLRTPLATAKAVVSGLRSREVILSEVDRRELLETADDALDRLAALVDNLLDLSRLQAGALPVRTGPVSVHDVVARALDDLGVATPGRRAGPARGTARRGGRPRTPRAGDRQPGGQRPASRARSSTADCRRRRRPRRTESHRHRSRNPAARPRPGVRALPATRRHQHRRTRPGAGTLPRPGGSHGWDPGARGDPGRRPHSRHLAPGRRCGAPQAEVTS